VLTQFLCLKFINQKLKKILIGRLKNKKAPGFDKIAKNDFFVENEVFIECMQKLINTSLAKHQGYGNMVWSGPYTKVVLKVSMQITDQ